MPEPKKIWRLAAPGMPQNRSERRQAARARGERGSKAKRQKPIAVPTMARPPIESPEMKAAREAFESQQKTIEAAQSLRQLTAGRMWLPGDAPR